MSLLQYWTLRKALNRLKALDLYGRERQGVRNAAKSRSLRVVCVKTQKTEKQSSNAALKKQVDIVGEYAYLCCGAESDEKIDTSLTSVH